VTAADEMPGDARPVVERRPKGLNTMDAAICFSRWQPPDPNARRELVAVPQSLFRADGLWLWGTDETTLVHDIKAGNQCCLAISTTPLPGLYFEAGLSFAEFEQLLETRREGWMHERLRALPPMKTHQKVRMLTVEIGNSLSLHVSGPLTHAVMWGKTVL